MGEFMGLPTYHKMFRSPLSVKIFANLWPPFLFSGIHIDHIAQDFHVIRVSLRDYFLNRNYVGTAFGGSLSAMTDPFYMIMFMNILGKEHYVWDKAGHIDFIAPGKGRLSVEFRLSDEQIAEIRNSAVGGEKVFRDFHCSVVDKEGNTVARVTRTIYVRLKPQHRPKT
jgi:acyl-coenzyme A thioesterase PaaI-like protein